MKTAIHLPTKVDGLLFCLHKIYIKHRLRYLVHACFVETSARTTQKNFASASFDCERHVLPTDPPGSRSQLAVLPDRAAHVFIDNTFR